MMQRVCNTTWTSVDKIARRTSVLEAARWPQSESGVEQDLDINDAEEVSSEFALVAANNLCISFQRFLSYNWLLRTTAWVFEVYEKMP